MHSHLHQPVSNHSSPEVTQKCSQTLFVSTLHQHAHLLCGRWVAAETSCFCGSISLFHGKELRRSLLFYCVHSFHHFHHLDHQSLQAGGLSDGQCVYSPCLSVVLCWLCLICAAMTDTVSLHRGGGTCGWTMPSGACSSPPFCWWSWCCCGPRPTARGQSQTGMRVFLFLKFEVKVSALVPIPQVFSFSSNWRWWGRRG